ncbi:MAG: CAAX prenyl protease-related protein [Pseudomonadota bacterium]|nr:CAAX prenyl protease-related protein [Pseudomonadota bacterium]
MAQPPAFDRAAWVRILPFAAYLSFFLVGDVLARLGVDADSLRWLYTVKTVTVVALLALFWRDYSELKIGRPSLGVMLSAIAAGVVVFFLWINLHAPWMVIGTSGGFDPRTGGVIDWPLVVVRIAGAALVVPVMEELFWRSFVMRWIDQPNFLLLDPAQAGVRGFVISVVLFGFEHNLWLAGIVAGVAYSVLFMRHRTLWSPILAHAVTNGMLGAWVVITGSWSYW